MTDKIVSLDGKEYLPEEEKLEPVEPLVERLEEMLEKAKSGELVNLTYVCQTGESKLSSAYVGAMPIHFDMKLLYSRYLELLKEAYDMDQIYAIEEDE